MDSNAMVRQQTLQSIYMARDAATGLGDRVKQQTQQHQVSLAVREIAEAETWANNSDTPEAIKIVELLLDLALWRLTTVALAIETDGPYAVPVM